MHRKSPILSPIRRIWRSPATWKIETKTALARPDGGNRYGATALELEYGARAWWTTELYLDGQATSRDSALVHRLPHREPRSAR